MPLTILGGFLARKRDLLWSHNHLHIVTPLFSVIYTRRIARMTSPLLCVLILFSCRQEDVPWYSTASASIPSAVNGGHSITQQRTAPRSNTGTTTKAHGTRGVYPCSFFNEKCEVEGEVRGRGRVLCLYICYNTVAGVAGGALSARSSSRSFSSCPPCGCTSPTTVNSATHPRAPARRKKST